MRFPDAVMYGPELFRELYAHMEWADARVWSQVLKTERAHGDERLRDKLFHLHDTQQAFLSLWTGHPRRPPEDIGSLAAVYEWARPYYAAARRFLDATGAETLAGPVSDVFADRMKRRFGDQRGSVTLGVTAFHVTAHTTHHRGQVMTRLRELGGEPPLVDYVIWLWSGMPAAVWVGPPP